MMWWLLAAALADPLATYEAATAAERAGDPARAYALYQQALAEDPDFPRSSRAERRLALLEERSADGFAAYRALEAVRRADPAPADAFAQVWDIATGGGPEPVRLEATLWLADRAEGREAEVLPLLEALEVPREHPAWRGTQRRLTALRVATGAPLPEEAPTQVKRQVQQREDQALAWLVGGLAAGTSLPLVVLGVRGRGPRPMGPVLLLVIGAVAWGLCEGWQHGAGAGVPWATLGSVLVHVASARALAVRPAGWVRACAVLATLCVWWLALYFTDTLVWLS